MPKIRGVIWKLNAYRWVPECRDSAVYNVPSEKTSPDGISMRPGVPYVDIGKCSLLSAETAAGMSPVMLAPKLVRMFLTLILNMLNLNPVSVA